MICDLRPRGVAAVLDFGMQVPEPSTQEGAPISVVMSQTMLTAPGHV